MALIGYARVSTEDQATFSQLDDLKAAGFGVIFEEKASGASRSRPELAKAGARMQRGDILVVARIDRLARSLSHLLEVIEGLETVGAHFKSLRDPIDTSTPQGKFALQVLGVAAELERALIRERTKAGLRAAKARGRAGGNPALKRRDPEAIARLSAIRDRHYMAGLLASMEAWLPKVRALRPAHSWGKVVKSLGRLGSPDQPWTADRLSRAVLRLVTEGLIEPALIAPAPRKPLKDDILLVIAGIKGADPEISLRAIAARLEDMRIRTPRGGTTWSASSVKNLRPRQGAGADARSGDHIVDSQPPTPWDGGKTVIMLGLNPDSLRINRVGSVYRAVAAHSPAAEGIIPPRASAVPSAAVGSAPTKCDRRGWQRAAQYGRRSLGEVAMMSYKQLIGRNIRARSLSTQKRSGPGQSLPTSNTACAKAFGASCGRL